MDPISLAIIAAQAKLSEQDIKDGYEGLKALIVRKFGAESDVAKAVENVENEPNSRVRNEMLKEKIAAAKADTDPELARAATALAEIIKAKPGGMQVIQTAAGNQNIQITGDINATEMSSASPAATRRAHETAERLARLRRAAERLARLRRAAERLARVLSETEQPAMPPKMAERLAAELAEDEELTAAREMAELLKESYGISQDPTKTREWRVRLRMAVEWISRLRMAVEWISNELAEAKRLAAELAEDEELAAAREMVEWISNELAEAKRLAAELAEDEELAEARERIEWLRKTERFSRAPTGTRGERDREWRARQREEAEWQVMLLKRAKWNRIAREKEEQERLAREKGEQKRTVKLEHEAEQKARPERDLVETSDEEAQASGELWEREKPKREQTENAHFKITLSHPKLLSKRHTSSFVVRVYLPALGEEVEKQIRSELANVEASVHTYDGELTIGHVVKVILFSPEIKFSDPVIKKLDSELNTISFLGRPLDDCKAGLHQASLIISDDKTGRQYQSVNFPIEIVDFAFDHISRPLLSNLMTGVLGIGSLVMFILTLLGQIDTSFGLTSGTTAGVIASGVYLRFLSFYQRPSMSNP